MKLYLAVTPDRYELPLCVQDSPGELAEALGITINAVRTACAPGKASKSGTRRGYRIVRIEVKEKGLAYREDYDGLLAEGNLLMKRGSREAMQISYRCPSQTAQGNEQIEVRGQTLMSWLLRRIVLTKAVTAGQTGQQILRQMLTQNLIAPADEARRIPRTAWLERADFGDAPIENYSGEEHAVLLDSVEGLLAASALGLRVLTDLTAGVHWLDVYRGRDLTSGQADNDPCLFSTDFDTLGAHSYTHSTEGYRNTAYVYGADDTAVVNGSATGLNRREIAVEAGDIARQYTDENGSEVTLSEAQAISMLSQRGTEELRGMLEELTFEGTLNNAAQMKSGVDFDIGDRVTCMNRRWGIALDVRIAEMTEIRQGSKTEVTATFGEGTPSLRASLRQMVKGR